MLVSWSASASKIPTIYDKCSSKITTGDHLPRIHKLHESLRPPPLGDVWKTPQKRNHGSNHWIDKGRRGGNPEEVYLVDTSSPRKRIRSSNLASSPTGVIILPQPKQGTISGKSFKITIKLNTKGKSLQNYHINLHCLIPPQKNGDGFGWEAFLSRWPSLPPHLWPPQRTRWWKGNRNIGKFHEVRIAITSLSGGGFE